MFRSKNWGAVPSETLCIYNQNSAYLKVSEAYQNLIRHKIYIANLPFQQIKTV